MSAVLRADATMELTFEVRGDMRRNEPMSRHTSWRVGGPADWYFIPADREDLAVFLRQWPRVLPLYFTGLGSNLLVRDGGIRGGVVATHKGLGSIVLAAPDTVRAEAGAASAKAARFSVRNGLRGAEFLAGIPGSIGGALAMNAGAFDGETWGIVASVVTVDRSGRFHRRRASDFSVGYRSVTAAAAGEWFVEADLVLESGSVAEGRARIRELLDRRGSSQPVQSANAGSVFRNPPGDYAARLIESVGLKGMRCGDAEVSRRHANFIINRGHAMAADVEELIRRIRAEVLRETGVELVPEVRVVGERA
jgi:UDP-N-acetylmuramate dehydrogenase